MSNLLDYTNFHGRQLFIPCRPEIKTVEQRRADSVFETAGNHGQIPLSPIHIDWETSTYCNLNCKMCYRRQLKIEPKLADFDLYQKAMLELKRLGAAPLSMKFNYRGEPLTHPQLPEFITLAKKCGVVDTRINTNGLLLDPFYVDDLAEAGLDYLIVSVDAASPETYEKVRGSRKDYLTLMMNLQDAINFYGDGPPFIHLNFVIQDANRHEVDDFVGFWRDKVHGIRLIKVRDVSDTASDSSGLDTPHFCRQPFQRIIVTVDGELRMCCGDWAGEFSLGRIDPDHPGISILEAWNAGTSDSKKLADVRIAMYRRDWDALPEVCQKCEVNKW